MDVRRRCNRFHPAAAPWKIRARSPIETAKVILDMNCPIRQGRTAAILGVVLLVGCGGGPVTSPEAMNESYQIALDLTEGQMGRFGSGSVREREVLEGLSRYFASMTSESVAAQTRLVYAQNAYLNDNLAFIEGAEAIEAYFGEAVVRADEIRLEFLDVSRSSGDYYIRWRMAITSERLNGGAPMVSFGVTHFRFDSAGRVLIHKDFWDAGTGLYEYLPGIGGLIRSLRGRLLH
jgi:hypothetical protein